MKIKRKHVVYTIIALNALAILMLWLCCASTWIHPEKFPRLSLLGLLFPVFLLIDLAFTIPWLFLNRRWAWVPLASILPCIGFVLDYCPITFRKTVPDGCIKLVTWNTNNFGSQSSNKEEAINITIEYLKNCDADIICLQESSGRSYALDRFYEYMDSVGYYYDKYRGNILLTRFPILQMDSIDYPTHIDNGVKGNGSKWYKLKYGNSHLMLVNNHLESNRLSKDVKEEYVSSLDDAEYQKFKQSGRKMGRNLKTSTTLRGPQADSLANFAERHKGEYVILCGDFNDTPISYTYQHLTKHLTNAYRQSGRGIGVSYNQKGFWVRIDHVFVSENCQTYNTHIDNSIKTSDHYPLVSWIKMD